MLGLLFATAPLHAEERRASRGERLALEGRCDVAIPELSRELETAPDPGRISWRLGQCLLHQQRYAEAAAALERAVAADASLLEAQLDLARARYHLGDLDGADAALRASQQGFSEEAIWNLYRGMVDLERGDAEAAVAALERAVEINRSGFRTRSDLQAVEPVASYYLGIAQRAAGQEAQAAATLRGVAEEWAGTDWAAEARRAVGAERGASAWLTLSSGGEYDDNVVLSGRDTPLPSDISDEAGYRAVWAATGGADLLRRGRNAAGLLASYNGRYHLEDDLSEFDSHVPTASLWWNHALRADTNVRLRYNFGYAWVDRDPYVVTNGGRASLIRAWSSRQNSALAGSLYVDEYLFTTDDVPDGPGTPNAPCGPLSPPFTVCGPPGLDEGRARNRDGWGARGTLSHGWSPSLDGFPLPDPALHGSYTYTYFDAEGREYSHQSHAFTLGVSFALPYGVGLDLDGAYTYRLYRNPSTYPQQEDLVAGLQYPLSGTRRRESSYVAGARLSVPLVGPVSATASYRYRDNRSTSDVFDYDQHVIGLLLNVTLSRPRS